MLRPMHDHISLHAVYAYVRCQPPLCLWQLSLEVKGIVPATLEAATQCLHSLTTMPFNAFHIMSQKLFARHSTAPQ